MGGPVHLELTGDEALVLFEFLARFEDGGTLAIQDQAEERAHRVPLAACPPVSAS